MWRFEKNGAQRWQRKVTAICQNHGEEFQHKALGTRSHFSSDPFSQSGCDWRSATSQTQGEDKLSTRLCFYRLVDVTPPWPSSWVLSSPGLLILPHFAVTDALLSLKEGCLRNSLEVWWLELGAFTVRAWVQFLIKGLRSRKPHSLAKKKKKNQGC